MGRGTHLSDRMAELSELLGGASANQGQMPAEGEIRVEVDAKEFAARIGGSCDGDVDRAHGDPCVGFIVLWEGVKSRALVLAGASGIPFAAHHAI